MGFKLNEHLILVRTATVDRPIVILQPLKKPVLWLNHYPVLAAHPGWRKLRAKLGWNLHWWPLTNNCYVTLCNCPNSARNRLRLHCNVGDLTLFPANAPLESVRIDISRELIYTPRWNRYILFIVDRLKTLVRSVLLNGVPAGEVFLAFFTHWVFLYGPPTDLIADNGK